MTDPIFDPPYERRPKERYYQFSALYEPFPEKYMNPMIDEICRRDQGGAGTCVGQSTAYAMDLNYKRINPCKYDTMVKRGGRYDELSEYSFSAACAYHWSREEGKITFPSGSFIWAAMQALKNRGICLDSQWLCSKDSHYPDVRPYPGDIIDVNNTAKEHVIDGYVLLNNKDEVKAAIYKYGFCVGGIDVYSNWKDGDIGVTGHFPERQGGVIGGHALVWIGYDNEKLYCLHSWGNFPWVGSISWKYFELSGSEFFAIIDEKEVQIVKRAQSRVEFRADVPAELYVDGVSHGLMPVALQLENVKVYQAVANNGVTVRRETVCVDSDRTVHFRFLPKIDYFDFLNRLRARIGWPQRVSNISKLTSYQGITNDIEALIREFCNNPDEWHALWYGWFAAGEEGMVKFTLDRIPEYLPDDVKTAIRKEYHYYNVGWYARKFWDANYKGIPIGKGTTAAAVIAAVGKYLGYW